MVDQPILFVSAGMLQPKKQDHALARLHNYLNFSLLGLATVVAQTGRPTQVIHGGFHDPAAVWSRLRHESRAIEGSTIFLSIPSVYAIPWARGFCVAVKSDSPGTRIVAGGRSVIEPSHDWIAAQLPAVDQFIGGYGESQIKGLVGHRGASERLHHQSSRAAKTVLPLPLPDHRLMEDYLEYQPSFEVARGCGMDCRFCCDANTPLGPLRHEEDVSRMLGWLAEWYGTSAIHPYLQASTFRPTLPWATALAQRLELDGHHIEWRCQTRVDAIPPAVLEQLAFAGLKVVDLGLESASPTQLLRMRKTTDPIRYLDRADSMLSACRSLGIWAKVNLLLYPGETQETVNQTCEWLDLRSEAIKGVSVNPLTVYGVGPVATDFLGEISELGAWPADPSDTQRFGFSRLNLSRALDYDTSIGVATTMAQTFMRDADYFDLKSFTYFPRHFARADFYRIVDESPGTSWPFRLASTANPKSVVQGEPHPRRP